MEIDEKAVRYRATKIVERTGISFDQALIAAAEELQTGETALKGARREFYKNKNRKKMERFKKQKARRTLYTPPLTGMGRIVRGGLPGLGKKR